MMNATASPPVSTERLSTRTALLLLAGAAMITMLLWQFPQGHYVLYPFTILSTWFHEMGHGLMAMMMGAKFDRLLLFPGGSGLAQYRFASSDLWLGNAGLAMIAAAGPMAPPIAGSLFILAGRHFRLAHYVLYLFSAVLLVSAAIWVRSGFGLFMIGALALIVLAIGAWAPRWLQGFSIQFIGVQACVSSYRQIDYLFMHSVNIDDRQMLSDTAKMAEYLYLPYWFWGGLMALLSLVILAWSLYMAYRR